MRSSSGATWTQLLHVTCTVTCNNSNLTITHSRSSCRTRAQFNLGHLETLAKAKSGLAEAGLGDLVLGGNYVCGGWLRALVPVLVCVLACACMYAAYMLHPAELAVAEP